MKISHKVVLCLLSLMFNTESLASAQGLFHAGVTVHNQCNMPITFLVNDPWGSVWNGQYSISQAGAKDQNNAPLDELSFVFSSNIEAEYYTINFQSAQCKIDYSMIQHYDFLTVNISHCDTKPVCEVKPAFLKQAY